MLRVIKLQVGFLLRQGDDEITGHIVGAGIGLVLVDNLGVAGSATLNLDSDGRGLAQDAVAVADGALVLDGLAAAAAGVALGLDLLEHAGRQLMLDDADAVAAAVAADVDDAVLGAAAVALLADLLLVPLELGVAAVVEVAQGHADLHLDAVPARLAPLVVPAPAEEAAEQVEGVMVAAALLLLLQALVAVLVVDLARVSVDQGLVGFGDLDESLVGGVIVTAQTRVS